MESVFATISMALRGSTISLSLSFLRTQSGTNLKYKDRMFGVRAADIRHTCGSVCAALHVLGCRAGFTRRGLNEKASVDRCVHLLFDDGSFRVHLVFASREAVDAAYPIQHFGELHNFLDSRREKKNNNNTINV